MAEVSQINLQKLFDSDLIYDALPATLLNLTLLHGCFHVF